MLSRFLNCCRVSTPPHFILACNMYSHRLLLFSVHTSVVNSVVRNRMAFTHTFHCIECSCVCTHACMHATKGDQFYRSLKNHHCICHHRVHTIYPYSVNTFMLFRQRHRDTFLYVAEKFTQKRLFCYCIC